MNYPLHALQLESPGYMGMKHGHHHERDLTVLTDLECSLIDLCFCPACTDKAERQQIDIGRVKAISCAVLEAAMVAAPERPAGHPKILAEIEDQCPDLTAFLSFRQGIEDSLLQEIKAAIRTFSTQLWHFGASHPQIADVVDVYHGSVYGQKADGVLASTQRLRQQIPEQHGLYMGVRLGLNSVRDAMELTKILYAIRDGGGDGVMFYNYSESPKNALNWIKSALFALGTTT
jgi:hypothetical protein